MGDPRRVTQELVEVEYQPASIRRVTQILVEVEYLAVPDEAQTQVRGHDQIQPWSITSDRLSQEVAGDGLRGGGPEGPLWVDAAIYPQPTVQGQALVSNVIPQWTPSLTPTWLGEHVFNAGLAIPAAQAITMGDEAYIGCGPADVRIVFDAGNDIALLGGNVGIKVAAPVYTLDVYHATDNFIAHFKSGDDLGGVIIADNDTTGYVLVKDGCVSIGGWGTLNAGNLTEVMASGWIGIGTVTPYGPLEISRPGPAFLVLRSSTEAIANTAYLEFLTGSGAPAAANELGRIHVNIVDADPNPLKTSLGFDVNTGDNVLEVMKLHEDGDVEIIFGSLGVGTPTPGAKLVVRDLVPGSPEQIRVEDDSAVNYGRIAYDQSSSTVFGFYNVYAAAGSRIDFGFGALAPFATTPKMTILGSGRVAVGTIVPFGPFHVTDSPGSGMFVTADDVDNNAVTIIPNATGDVTVTLTALYSVSESGGGTDGGVVMVLNNSSVDLYDDGTDILTLAVAADGSATLQRTAGATTFDVSLWLTWL